MTNIQANADFFRELGDCARSKGRLTEAAYCYRMAEAHDAAMLAQQIDRVRG